MRIFRKSIKTRLISIFIACAIVPFIVQNVVVSSLYAGRLEKKLNEASLLGLERLSWEIGLNLQKLQSMSSHYTSNDQLTSLMRGALKDPAKREQAHNVLTAAITANRRDTDIHMHVLIVGADGAVYSLTRFGDEVEDAVASGVFRDAWYRESFKNQSGTIWLGLHDSYDPYGTGKGYYMARHLVSEGEYVGTVLVSIDDSMLYRLFDRVKISEDSGIFMVDQHAGIMLGSSANPANIGLLKSASVLALLGRGSADMHGYRIVNGDGGKYLVSSQAMPDFGWNLVSVTPERSVLKEMSGVRVLPLVLLVVMLAFMILFVVILNREIFIPVLELSGSLAEVQKGNLDVSVSLPYDNEIGELGKGFNGMTADLKLYIRQIQAEEEQKRRLEVKALESQIKPHFIYNTLNSIKWMAEIQGAKSVSDAIVAMVSLIEYNVGTQGILVMVAEEEQALRNYIYLQQLRHWNSFEASFAIAEDTRGLYIPRLSLQPIVENSITHGLSGLSRKGELRISSRLTEEGLLFSIEDNGTGMSPEKLDSAMHEEPVDEMLSHKGVGIHNVNQRIKLRYGGAYGLTFQSAPGEGTVARLLFPVLRARDEGAEP